MKKSMLILGTAALFVIGSLTITGCESTEQKNEEELEQHEDETGDHNENGEQMQGNDMHMGHMNDIRQWLKQELGDKYNQPVPPGTEKQLVLGKITYTKLCASCHGNSGKGDGPVSVAFEQKPADFTDPVHSKYYSDKGRIHIIENGVPETPMVGWKSTLNDKEIQAVYSYVLSLRSSEETGEHNDGDDHDH